MDAGIKVAVVNTSNAVCYDTSYGPCFGVKDLRVESTNIIIVTAATTKH